MNCKKCDAENEESSKFCGNCGQLLSQEISGVNNDVSDKSIIEKSVGKLANQNYLIILAFLSVTSFALGAFLGGWVFGVVSACIAISFLIVPRFRQFVQSVKFVAIPLIIVMSLAISLGGFFTFYFFNPGKSNSTIWINIGEKVTEVEKDPEKILAIPYRMYGVKSVDKNIDIVDLELAVQSRSTIGKEVMLSVDMCYGPGVRDGYPTVMCSTGSGGTIYLSGNEQIRSQLLHLNGGSVGKEVGTAVGRIIGNYVNHPFIQIL